MSADVRVWADGLGNWHATVTVPNVGSAAGVYEIGRAAIVEAIVEREESPTRSADQIRNAVCVGMDAGVREDAGIVYRFAECVED